MFVVAFAPLIVESHDSLTALQLYQTIFVRMFRRGDRFGHAPYHEFHAVAGFGYVLEAGNQFGLHVGDIAITIGRCQIGQQK